MVVTWSSLQDEKLRDLDLRFKVMLYMAHGRLQKLKNLRKWPKGPKDSQQTQQLESALEPWLYVALLCI